MRLLNVIIFLLIGIMILSCGGQIRRESASGEFLVDFSQNQEQFSDDEIQAFSGLRLCVNYDYTFRFSKSLPDRESTGTWRIHEDLIANLMVLEFDNGNKVSDMIRCRNIGDETYLILQSNDERKRLYFTKVLNYPLGRK